MERSTRRRKGAGFCPLEFLCVRARDWREGAQRRKIKGSQSQNSKKERQWSVVSITSKMRTEECPLDLATLRSSVTFVEAVFSVVMGWKPDWSG